MGWSYTAKAAADLIEDMLADAVLGRSAFAIGDAWNEMNRRLRNTAATGLGLMAVAAVDIALWDLKARLLNVSLLDLFGGVREYVTLYGSGGFTSYTDERLVSQLTGFAAAGFTAVKMKVGRDAGADAQRVRLARYAIGDSVGLFVDANGAYSRKLALDMAHRFAEDANVRWFEEPIASRDLSGLRLLRDRGPAGLDIAAGEYGDTVNYFREMLEAGAVDCLQVDVTRCGGYTGFLKAASLCDAFELPMSAHCAPQLHAHVGCAASRLRHVEYFYDHDRIEGMLFDGVLPPAAGTLRPDRARAGHGLSLKRQDADAYRIA
jgi:L-alanine-DL-glutamate epimerase-like enolase superfamily enzyme